MEQLTNLKNICSMLLESVRQEPEYNLPLSKRIAVYRAFGDSNYDKNTWSLDNNRNLVRSTDFTPSTADKALGWLAILTAKKVLPLLQTSAIENDAVHATELLEVAEGVLTATYSANLAMDEFCNRFYSPASAIAYATSLTGDYVNSSAYQTLGIALKGLTYHPYEPIKNYRELDFADCAVKAYSTFDSNKPGLALTAQWQLPQIEEYKQELEALNKLEMLDPANQQEKQDLVELIAWRSNSIKDYTPVIVDVSKKLEFWEWWLTEAVLQAWKLAQ